jgi:prevent-host-death family protein
MSNMVSVGMHEAKTQLSKLVEKAEQGEEVVITRHGRPIVKLTRIAKKLRPKPGLFEDQILFIAPDAFDAVSDQEVDSWLEK